MGYNFWGNQSVFDGVLMVVINAALMQVQSGFKMLKGSLYMMTILGLSSKNQTSQCAACFLCGKLGLNSWILGVSLWV
jgi:hypothetical protein